MAKMLVTGILRYTPKLGKQPGLMIHVVKVARLITNVSSDGAISSGNPVETIWIPQALAHLFPKAWALYDVELDVDGTRASVVDATYLEDVDSPVEVQHTIRLAQ